MGIQPIESYGVGNGTFEKLWGVTVNDYKYGGVKSDFETLLIRVSTTRAAKIEREITPVSTLVRRRNEQISKLGEALSELTGCQAELEKKDSKDASVSVSEKTAQLVNSLTGKTVISGSGGKYSVSKATAAEAIELVKTRMDKLNNDSQNDLTRVQSLVSRRDESFQTASSLMTGVSDTRGNAIKNMG